MLLDIVNGIEAVEDSLREVQRHGLRSGSGMATGHIEEIRTGYACLSRLLSGAVVVLYQLLRERFDDCSDQYDDGSEGQSKLPTGRQNLSIFSKRKYLTSL